MLYKILWLIPLWLFQLNLGCYSKWASVDLSFSYASSVLLKFFFFVFLLPLWSSSSFLQKFTLYMSKK